jgi:hypothetical protein
MFHSMRTIWPLLVLATLASASAAQAMTYYVDRNLPGSDSNNGTSESKPFRTIAKCVTVAINPGDTCLVKNGNYPETIDMTRSGTAENPITLKNYPGHAPILNFTAGTVSRVYLHAAAGPPNPIGYITVSGFVIENAFNAFKIEAGDHIIISGNTIRNTANSAILGGGRAVTVDRNLFVHNGFAPTGTIDVAYAMYVTGQNWIITNNIFNDSNGFHLQLKAGAFNPATDPNASYSGWGNALIANNTFVYSAKQPAIVFWGGGGPTGVGTGNIVRNNIFHQNNQAGSGAVGGIYFLNPAAGIVTVDHNLFFATAPRSTTFIASNTGTVFWDVSGGNGFLKNPNMINAPDTLPASPDFHLTGASSSALGLGSNLTFTGSTQDLEGKIRPAMGAWDLGAYQFSGQLAGSPPTAPVNLRVH